MDNLIFVILVLGVIAVVAVTFSGSSPFSSPGGPIATGPGSSSEIRNPQPVQSGRSFLGFSNIFNSPPPQLPSPIIVGLPASQLRATKPGYSQYEGAIRISNVDRSSASPKKEYITLRNGGYFGFGSTQIAVNITGWTIENSKKEKYAIPKALNIPYIDADTVDILLPSGGEIYAVTGSSDIGMNFRENGCTGYLNQYYQITPPINGSCMDHQSSSQIRSRFLDIGLSGECIDFVSSLPSCRIPTFTFENSGKIGNNCITYISQNISYNGCVKNYRNDKNFMRNTWHVFLNRSQKLFDPKHDRVILRDSQGLIVDQFEY